MTWTTLLHISLPLVLRKATIDAYITYGTRRGKPDFACNNFCGDQYWLFCLYAEYLSIFLNGNRPYVPTNEVMRRHFAKFWGFLVEYANVGGQGVVPPPRWAN